MNETFYCRFGKRWLDATLALAGLLVTSPLLVVIAVAIRLTSAGPVFFRQKRIGRLGRTFFILKFRTMIWQKDKPGILVTGRDDARITKLGRVLRNTKIDEIPQLVNILLGEMSLVGPRPEVPKFVATYDDWQKRVLVAKPGITGPAALAFVTEEDLLSAQGNKEGFYKRVVLPAKLELDLQYCENIRFLSDLSLIFRTAARLFTRSYSPVQLGSHRCLASDTKEGVPQKQQVGSDKLGRFHFYSRTGQLLVDSCIFATAITVAYLIRFEQWPTGGTLTQLILWLPFLVAVRLLVDYVRGTHRLIWRFISLPDAIEIAKSIILVSASLLAARLLVPRGSAALELIRLPFSVIALEGLLSLTGALSARATRRILYLHERKTATGCTDRPRSRMLLYGAGRAGQLLRRELENDPTIEVVGFVDDDRRKVGTVICRTRVLGSGNDLGQLVEQLKVDEVVVSMATASRQTLTQILTKSRSAGVRAKIIPTVQEILAGQARISQLRETKAEDLLGRDRIEVSGFQQFASPVYRDKRVLVTGAGGSIGSELVRQLMRLKPSRMALLDKDENSLYELEQELRLRRAPIPAEPQVADVRQIGRVRAIFSEFRPQVVFHAAAHKHVPLMELHPCEAILNNVCGTENVLRAVMEFQVERFVFISSDKAVNPVNVMGATKRIGEMLVQISGQASHLRSACVRFGNVLGSRGSVLPLFQKQIAEGGPVTITHPDVVRYFMTISEAVQLILFAGTLAGKGDVFVLDMGQPRNILQLANEMIVLSGLEPEKDIRTTITGLRPGEKLFEELASSSEILHPTCFEKLSVIEPQTFDKDAFQRGLATLIETAEQNDKQQLYEALLEMGLGYNPHVLAPRVATAAN